MHEGQCDLLCLELPRAEALRGRRMDTAHARVAASAAQALADPTRLTVAALLHEGGELCVCDLAWLTGRETNLVSHHLKVLRRSGLATSRREGKLILYTLTRQGHLLLEAALAFTALLTDAASEVARVPDGALS
jgi:ArsR family transcriptional regulator, lead/cadmium/zinc/bismuth-responsive transcriptional repressor